MKTHSIGIDFGTTKTLVSHLNSRTGSAETLRLGRSRDYLPTSVYVESDGHILFGDDADDMVEETSGVYLRGFKMQLGSTVPLLMCKGESGMRMLTAKDLVCEYLRYIKHLVEDRAFLGEPVTNAVITRPVNFTPAQAEELEFAARNAGFAAVEFTTEPEAAGLAFCILEAAHAFKGNALVVDWGGGTLDLALVSRKGDSVTTHRSHTAGDTTMGGEVFDERLWMYVDMMAKQQGITLNNVATLPTVRAGKEKLSVRESTNLRLSHSQGVTTLPVERRMFNCMIASDVDKAVAKVKALLQGIPADLKPEMLLLVGGSSQIPLIKEKLEEACTLPAKYWTYSREAVALGAALWITLQDKEQADSTNTEIPSQSRQSSTIDEPTITSNSVHSSEIFIDEILQIIQATNANFLKKRLNETGVDVNVCCQTKTNENQGMAILSTPLIEAVKSKSIPCVKVLLDNTADPNFETPEGHTALREAILLRNEDCIKLLLDAGANPDLICNNNVEASVYSPVHLAAQENMPEIVTLMLQKGVNVNLPCKWTLDTPLDVAVRNGHAACAAVLLQNGADLHHQNFIGNTALHETLWEYNPNKQEKISRCISLLIEHGANINHANEDGDTPLMIAVRKKAFFIVHQLLKEGADPTLRNHDNKAAFHYCPPLRNLSPLESCRLLDEIVTYAQREYTDFTSILLNRPLLKKSELTDEKGGYDEYVSDVFQPIRDTIGHISSQSKEKIAESCEDENLQRVYETCLSAESINHVLKEMKSFVSKSRKNFVHYEKSGVIGGLVGGSLGVAMSIMLGTGSYIYSGALAGSKIEKGIRGMFSEQKDESDNFNKKMNMFIKNIQASFMRLFYSLPLLAFTNPEGGESCLPISQTDKRS